MDKIGQGGMGEVYQAEDLKLGRRVAIKRLPAEATKDEKARQRFLREARSASALNHPNIVTIYAIEETDGFDFIAMEYVEGQSFRENIRRGPWGLPQLIEIGSQIADSLQAAHSIGLIHRDIKSANILLTPRGQAKVLDFGLAKMIHPFTGELNTVATTLASDLTDSGVIPGYGGLYVAGADARRSARCAVGHFLAGGSALRGRDGRRAVCRAEHALDHARDRDAGPKAAERNQAGTVLSSTARVRLTCLS